MNVTSAGRRSSLATLPATVCAAVIAIAMSCSVSLAQSSVDEARAAVDAAREDPATWVALGNAFLDDGDAEEAKVAFLESIALDYLACDGHFGLGLAEFRGSDLQAALFAFNEVTRLCADRFDGHYNRAVTLALLQRPDEASAAFRASIDQAEPEASTDDLVDAYVGLAGQRKSVGDFTGAAQAYESALDLRGSDDALLLLKAEALVRSGRGLEALPDLTDLESRSVDYRVSALIADVYVGEGQVDYALRSLERALSRASEAGDAAAEARILVKRGFVERDQGRYATSLETFRAAMSADATAWEPPYNVGVSLVEAGRPGEALEVLELAESLAPDSGEVALALATVYDQLARPDDALVDALRALATLTDANALIEARFVAGRSAYRLGDYASSFDDFVAVVAARPNSSPAQLWAGLAAYQTGDFAASVPYFERAVALDPADPTARTNLGAAYLASERYLDAEAVYTVLLDADPMDAESSYHLGWALVGQDRLGPARDAWAASCEGGYRSACDALAEFF